MMEKGRKIADANHAAYNRANRRNSFCLTAGWQHCDWHRLVGCLALRSADWNCSDKTRLGILPYDHSASISVAFLHWGEDVISGLDLSINMSVWINFYLWFKSIKPSNSFHGSRKIKPSKTLQIISWNIRMRFRPTGWEVFCWFFFLKVDKTTKRQETK